MNLAEMRTRVRRDLHDEDASNYRWTDDELDRHVERSVREFSLALPRQMRATLTTVAGSRALSLATLAGLVAVEAAEYPADEYPPRYVRFSLWGDALTMLVDGIPAGGESVYLYYGALHTLDGSTSTIPPALEDVVATGAAAYAALEWSSFATNRVNVGAGEVCRDYLVWGQERLAAFSQALARHGRGAAVRARQLHRPYEEPVGQSTDWGP